MQKEILFLLYKLHYKLFDIKAYCYSKIFRSCGVNFKVFGNVHIKNPDRIVIGNNVTINDGAYLNGLGGIKVGDNVSISALSIIVSTGLDINSFLSNKIHYNGKIIIGNNVQIGAGSIILANTKIGNNVIVGAGSVVAKNIVSNSVVAGVPAKIIRKLDE